MEEHDRAPRSWEQRRSSCLARLTSSSSLTADSAPFVVSNHAKILQHAIFEAAARRRAGGQATAFTGPTRTPPDTAARRITTRSIARTPTTWRRPSNSRVRLSLLHKYSRRARARPLKEAEETSAARIDHHQRFISVTIPDRFFDEAAEFSAIAAPSDEDADVPAPHRRINLVAGRRLNFFGKPLVARSSSFWIRGTGTTILRSVKDENLESLCRGRGRGGDEHDGRGTTTLLCNVEGRKPCPIIEAPPPHAGPLRHQGIKHCSEPVVDEGAEHQKIEAVTFDRLPCGARFTMPLVP